MNNHSINFTVLCGMGKQSIADLRRGEILSTFYEVAKHEGLEKTSFAMIAQQLEIQPSLIVHYFKNRDELIIALIQYNLDQYERIFLLKEDPYKDLPAQQRLLRIIEKIFSKEWNDLFDDGVFYNCYSMLYRYDEIKTKFRELHIKIRSHIEHVIEECNREGALAVENEYLLAQHIANLMDGAYYYIGMLSTRKEQDTYMAQTRSTALALLNWKKEPLEVLT